MPLHSLNVPEKQSKKSSQPQNERVEAYKQSKGGSFSCDMTSILALETPLSDFLDNFRRGILGSPRRESCISPFLTGLARSAETAPLLWY